ncbi:MAG: Flp family type IVb pilin [Proteobacteria bacterium]|nr:Flp family type IVb pilin [Pseudomonadota bacterium]
MNTIRRLFNDSRGMSTLEYGILFVLIVASTVGLWQTAGTHLVKQLKDSNKEFKAELKRIR